MNNIDARLYLIAHAPATPWQHFNPTHRPKPKRDPKWNYCNNCRDDVGECQGGKQCKELVNFFADCGKWEDEEIIQTRVQWPIFWADAMLAQISKTESPGQTILPNPAVTEVRR